MARNLASLLTLLVLALPALGQGRMGSISGLVRDSSGAPQMGAAVKVLAGASTIATVFTDTHGRYLAHDLAPGTYQVKAQATAFLPALRENISLKAGAHLVINLTLNTLFEAIQLVPNRRATEDQEDWKWTLRSAANRPILRLVDDSPLVVVANSENERALQARVAFFAGADAQGFGSASDMTTAFSLQSSLFSAGTVSLRGNLGYGAGAPSGVVRAAYSHPLGNGSHPEVALTMRRFASPDAVARNAALQALALSVSDRMTIGDFLELQYGSEFQSVQFLGHVNAYRPFGAAALHLGPNTVVEYRYATSQPNTRLEKGFDSAPADLSESGPRVSMLRGAPQIERAAHQEVALSRRFGKTSVQLAAYHDRVSNTALTGVGDLGGDTYDRIPDVYSGTFTYNGGNLTTNGMRVVVQRKFASSLTGTLDYAMGGVLDSFGGNWETMHDSLHSERRESVAAKVDAVVPRARTRVIASYRWLNGGALTPVDMFDASAGQSDAFASLFVRQPVPCGLSMCAGKLEALVDVRNLLAQGYVPVVGQDGRTVYLVQSARSVRGGLAFTF